MAYYLDDRAFTDHIHNNVAIPKIYNPIGWQQVVLNATYAEHIDMNNGIDYIFNHNGETKTVQERFRDKSYERYSDFTIRYRRDNNKHSDRHESEYFKIEADYFTYGISNCSKTSISTCTDFIKYAVIDLKKVLNYIDKGLITINHDGWKKGMKTCRIINGKTMDCPVIPNKDGSSSFVPFEISYLVKLWGNDIIVAQKGFI